VILFTIGRYCFYRHSTEVFLVSGWIIMVLLYLANKGIIPGYTDPMSLHFHEDIPMMVVAFGFTFNYSDFLCTFIFIPFVRTVIYFFIIQHQYVHSDFYFPATGEKVEDETVI
jgi:energy-converting hydrogenase Eha subunit E